MNRRGNGEHDIGESFDAFLRAHGFQAIKARAEIDRCWAEAAGPEVAAHVRPLSVRDETLLVAVDHPAWAAQLRFLIPDLLARLAELLGSAAPRRIEVTVRPSQGVE